MQRSTDFPVFNHRFTFTQLPFDNLSEDLVLWNSDPHFEYAAHKEISIAYLEVNHGLFVDVNLHDQHHHVAVIFENHQPTLLCNCNQQEAKLCRHQAQALITILKTESIRIFFSTRLRHQKLRFFAQDYGLEKETDPDEHFSIQYQDGKVIFKPRQSGLIAINRETLSGMKNSVLPPPPTSETYQPLTVAPNLLVLRGHKYYQYLLIELYHAPLTKIGKPKNPFALVEPLTGIWQNADADYLRFLISVAQFQNRAEAKLNETSLKALKLIVKNPLDCQVFCHNPQTTDAVTASSIVPVTLKLFDGDIYLQVERQEHFFQISGRLHLNGRLYSIKDTSLKFGYFLSIKENLYLIDDLAIVGVIELLKKNPDGLYIHSSKFKDFKNEFLNVIEDKIHIHYSFIPPATATQLSGLGFESRPEYIIYLSDLSDFVKIIPVVRYGEVEIPIRSKRQIYGIDPKGHEYRVDRRDDLELELTSILVRQHKNFGEQLENELDHFYLHKNQFLSEDWFIKTFADWQERGITVHGFSEINGNKLHPHPAKITVKVVSGINWFNTTLDIRFGNRKVSLKKIQLAIRNKSKYIRLDDGTLGILPESWLEKFSQYFDAATVIEGEILLTAKVNFATIHELYDEEMLDDKCLLEIRKYRQLLAEFKTLTHVPPSDEFKGTLRPYQQEGLNWLNFLDDFNFGGCLADDMGLGKSIQIIAFILLQRQKVQKNNNLLVAPTTLLFNWQAEIKKFAPSLSVYVIQGTNRLRDIQHFDQYEVILISYATLLSEVNYLRKYVFNYVFLDESQNIKNPDSQRYRAARLLQARNRISITGTPLENNTFDLFSQFSFTCPGLLGNHQYFRAIYAIPIDKFKNSDRARDLRDKIKPFLLRRTKQQVANDLPEKTEMILYCDMPGEQRQIYDAYEKEFREYISATDNETLKKNSMHVLKGLTKLRQICNSPKLIDSELRGDQLSSKMDMLIEQIINHSSHHKMLVFSQFVSMLNLIKIELIKKEIPFVCLTGASKNRQTLVEQFQNNPTNRVFLISLKAGATGLNLTEADYVFLVDPWWNPAVENQAIDRIHRIGQRKNVTAIRLICPNTIEDKMIILQQSKKSLTDDLIKADGSFFRSMTKKDLLNLVGHG